MRSVVGARAPDWIPAYAGMTIEDAGFPLSRERWSWGGAPLAGGVSSTLSRRFAASSPLIGRGGYCACAPLGSGFAGLCNGLYRERRIRRLRASGFWLRGVMQRPPQGEEDTALCAPTRRAHRAPSPYAPRGLVIPAKAGTYWGASVRRADTGFPPTRE